MEMDSYKRFLICNFCEKISGTMKKCGGCEMTRYCSMECQKKDWSEHKKHCEELKLYKPKLDFMRWFSKPEIITKYINFTQDPAIIILFFIKDTQKLKEMVETNTLELNDDIFITFYYDSTRVFNNQFDCIRRIMHLQYSKDTKDMDISWNPSIKYLNALKMSNERPLYVYSDDIGFLAAEIIPSYVLKST